MKITDKRGSEGTRFGQLEANAVFYSTEHSTGPFLKLPEPPGGMPFNCLCLDSPGLVEMGEITLVRQVDAELIITEHKE